MMKSTITVGCLTDPVKPYIFIEHRSGDGNDSLLGAILTQFKDNPGWLKVECVMVGLEPNNYMRGYRITAVPNVPTKE